MITERNKLPAERQSITKKITITHTVENTDGLVDLLQEKLARLKEAATNETNIKDTAQKILAEPELVPPISETIKIYVQIGLYPETGLPGEIFLKADRQGSTLSGMLDALSMAVSVGLQSGVPLSWFTSKMRNMQFEPAGATGDPEIKRASSVVDAVARYLDLKFPERE
jgi:hypothetical protein